jgi:arginine decarboxylase
MDQREAPLVDALAEYQRLDRYGFTPPGHRHGRGADPRTVEVLGIEPFRADVLASSGVDDRSSSGGVLKAAETLMAEAVGADHTFFSTCGSSLSVKAAMLAVAGTDADLLLGRDAHKSVVAGLVFSGLQPRWVRPRWDGRLHLSHPPSSGFWPPRSAPRGLRPTSTDARRLPSPVVPGRNMVAPPEP